MPELPEVETIKLGLQRKILHKTLKRVEIKSARSFLGKSSEVEGKKIEDIWRRAKILGIDLDGGKTLLFHLKMTGQLIYVFAKQKGKVLQASSKLNHTASEAGSYENGDKIIGGHPTPDMRGKMPNSHTRIIFEFSDGSKLYFNDQRLFGWVKVLDSKQVKDGGGKIMGKIGPEPLKKGFSWQILRENLLKHKKMPVKIALMDQSVVAGVGNIYASEACFGAGIDPRKKVGEVSDEEFKRLHQGVVKSLKNGIKYGGSTRAHFIDPEGRKGYFLDYAYVYGRQGQRCKKCGTPIEKITLGGRGTYFCPHCQKSVK